MIVKALFLDHQQQYIAQVLVLEPQPSADAGEASETIRLIEGRGSTLAEAVSKAESARAEELFTVRTSYFFWDPDCSSRG